MKPIIQEETKQNTQIEALYQKISQMGKQFNINMLTAGERDMLIANLRSKAREVYLDKREKDQTEIFQMR
jgi:hypothetical protein